MSYEDDLLALLRPAIERAKAKRARKAAGRVTKGETA